MTCRHHRRLWYAANRNARAHHGLNATVAVPVSCACMIAAMRSITGIDRIRLSQNYTDRITEGIRRLPINTVYSTDNKEESP